MPGKEQKRNSEGEMSGAEGLPGASAPGVGGRQGDSPTPGRGGGYQDSCTVLEFSRRAPADDPRLDELRRIGLQRVWIEVAQRIGVDAFLEVWRVLDADPSSYTGGRLVVPLRLYRSYLRFQRNRYIEALSARGLSPREIQRRVQQQLCESVSLRNIHRIGKRG